MIGFTFTSIFGRKVSKYNRNIIQYHFSGRRQFKNLLLIIHFIPFHFYYCNIGILVCLFVYSVFLPTWSIVFAYFNNHFDFNFLLLSLQTESFECFKKAWSLYIYIYILWLKKNAKRNLEKSISLIWKSRIHLFNGIICNSKSKLIHNLTKMNLLVKIVG